MVKWAAREVLKREMTSFSFVFVEKTPPYCVDVLTLDPADVELAEKDLRVALDTFAWCLEHKNWFGPSGTQLDARYVHISDRAKERAEFRRDFLRREIARAEAGRFHGGRIFGGGIDEAVRLAIPSPQASREGREWPRCGRRTIARWRFRKHLQTRAR
jgi:hypothetical protein